MDSGRVVICDINPATRPLEQANEIARALRKKLGLHYNVVTSQEVIDNPDLKVRVIGAVVSGGATAGINSLLPSLPNLKTVCCISAGLGNLDLQQCFQANVSVGTGSTALCEFVADFAMTLILSAAREVLTGVQIAKSGKLGCTLKGCGFHVTGSTLGIVGMGAVGYATAKRAHLGFDMNILYHSRKPRSAEEETYIGAKYHASLHDMLPRCDVVLLSCSLTADTRGLFGHKEFSLMKNTALLVNVARGQIVKQDELVTALQTGEIGQAALDVTDPEPLPENHPLLNMDNVTVTPHQAFVTPSTPEKIVDTTMENLKRGIEGKPLLCGIKRTA